MSKKGHVRPCSDHRAEYLCLQFRTQHPGLRFRLGKRGDTNLGKRRWWRSVKEKRQKIFRRRPTMTNTVAALSPSYRSDSLLPKEHWRFLVENAYRKVAWEFTSSQPMMVLSSTLPNLEFANLHSSRSIKRKAGFYEQLAESQGTSVAHRRVFFSSHHGVISSTRRGKSPIYARLSYCHLRSRVRVTGRMMQRPLRVSLGFRCLTGSFCATSYHG